MADFEWHSIRPWRPTLNLTVREITSVSVTFILSSPYTENPELSLASLGLSSSDDDEMDNLSADASQAQIVSDVLSKGLSVKVNGIPWQRVLMRIDDDADEAVIILFGLMPGRQYDVELGVVPGERSVRGQITTETAVNADRSTNDPLVDDTATGISPPSTVLSSQPSSCSSSLTSDGSHMTSTSHTPVPPAPTLTLEDRRHQLTTALSLLTQEHTQLSSALKTARREAQKADAALRAEIDALKRASEKQAATELRARQKVLALQEAAKQTSAATRALDELRADIEAALPALEARRREVEAEWTEVKGQADEVRRGREDAEGRERRRREAMQAEMGGLTSRLEKLNGKREKLEGECGILGELEERLRKLEEERERVESDPYGYEGETKAGADPSRKEGSSRDGEWDSRSPSHQEHHSHHNHHHSHLSHPRKRHSHPHTHHALNHQPSFPPSKTTPASRPEPIQRPSHGSRLSLPGHLSAGPGVIHLQTPPHMHGKPGRPAASPVSGSGSSSASSSAPPSAQGASSNLSSRAPPFEPSCLGARGQSASTAGRSELNPGSSPFEPRTAVAQSAGMQGPSGSGTKPVVTP
ncbi:hypothetical protein AcV7_001572 [Taiwanofungus camphoratus]|nr:hypothetical protein AcV7_001572 [Antrodia cinnamomea]